MRTPVSRSRPLFSLELRLDGCSGVFRGACGQRGRDDCFAVPAPRAGALIERVQRPGLPRDLPGGLDQRPWPFPIRAWRSGPSVPRLAGLADLRVKYPRGFSPPQARRVISGQTGFHGSSAKPGLAHRVLFDDDGLVVLRVRSGSHSGTLAVASSRRA